MVWPILLVAAAMPSTVDITTARDSSQETVRLAQAEQKPAALCSAEKFREFDFWAGSWEVADGSGTHAGHNEVTLEMKGCVLVERWKSAQGGNGISMNHYDPQAGKWHQHWVGLGLVLEMAGGMKDGSMELQGPLQYLTTGKTTLLRGIWTPLPDGRVRQHFLESTDDGKTWTEWFDGFYTRAKQASPATTGDQ